jgi:serine/threonine protein kinase
MSYFPDFSAQGYQVIRELGRNAAGGRVVYLCQTLDEPTKQIVIKQFQFAKGSGWSQFKEIEREMQVLKDLQHPGIPHYIGSIQTDDGYSIVQEFKDAQALSIPRSFDPDQIKQIAFAMLEILIYLQARIPVVIHRDIKPENVLVDEDLNVYLIDFGFARIGGGEVAMSSVAAGTFGFMAPEQMYNKGLTPATDLYGLGAMLIALLTQTRSTKMDALIAEDGKITFQHLTPKLSLRFMEWLEKMVAAKASDRYPDAKSALATLNPIYVTRYPCVEFSQPSLQFKANKLGEKVTQTITVTNLTAETLLAGTWSVAPHPHDPPQKNNGKHRWISFSSNKIEGNEVDCEITVDTSKLIAQSVGNRSLVLDSNAVPGTHSIPIEVMTAPLSIQVRKLPHAAMGMLLIFAFGCGRSLNVIGAWDRAIAPIGIGFLMSGISMLFAVNLPSHQSGTKIRTIAGIIIGVIVGCLNGGIPGSISGATFGGFAGFIAGGINTAGSMNGMLFTIQPVVGSITTSIFGIIAGSFASNMGAGIIAGSIVGIHAGVISSLYDTEYRQLPESRRYRQGFIFIVLEIITIFGINLGALLERPNLFPILVTLGSFGALVYLLLYLPSQRLKEIQAYRQRQKHLIKL